MYHRDKYRIFYDDKFSQRRSVPFGGSREGQDLRGTRDINSDSYEQNLLSYYQWIVHVGSPIDASITEGGHQHLMCLDTRQRNSFQWKNWDSYKFVNSVESAKLKLFLFYLDEREEDDIFVLLIYSVNSFCGLMVDKLRHNLQHMLQRHGCHRCLPTRSGS